MSNSPSVTPKTTSPIASLLDQYANLISGDWSIEFSPSTAPTASAATIGPFAGAAGGRLTAARILGGQAVEGTFEMGSISGKSTIVKDSATGKLKQTTVNSDGTTSVASIESGGGGQWIAATDCAAAAAQETSTDIITVSAGGDTLTHRITNRKLNGQPEPDLTAVFTRKSSPIQFGATATPISGTGPNLLEDWASLVTGQWTATFSAPATAVPPTGALSVGASPSSGTFAASRILGGKAVEGTFNLGQLSGKWTVVQDAAAGQLKQTTVNSDGSTSTATIVSLGGGSFRANTACPSASTSSAAETSVTTITVSDWGNTMTHHMTNRVSSNGTQRPDLVAVYKRVSTLASPVQLP